METEQIKLIKEQEMVCLNSILGGGKIQGLRLKLPFFYEEQYYIKSTMEQMYGDGLADKEGRLTVAGKIYARVLKDYKNSSTHIYIRNLRIGLLKDRELCTFIAITDNGYYMQYIDRESILSLLADGYAEQEENDWKEDLEIKKYQKGDLVMNHRLRTGIDLMEMKSILGQYLEIDYV